MIKMITKSNIKRRPRRHTTSFRRRIDVETTLCTYRGTCQLSIIEREAFLVKIMYELFSPKSSIIYVWPRNIPQFHLIFWCGKFVKRHSFRIVSGDRGNCAFPQNFHTSKLDEIKQIFAVFDRIYVRFWHTEISLFLLCDSIYAALEQLAIFLHCWQIFHHLKSHSRNGDWILFQHHSEGSPRPQVYPGLLTRLRDAGYLAMSMLDWKKWNI